jgi:hypothetical protein
VPVEGQVSSILSGFFQRLFTALMQCTLRPDSASSNVNLALGGFAACNTLVQNSAPDVINILNDLFMQVLQLTEQTNSENYSNEKREEF